MYLYLVKVTIFSSSSQSSESTHSDVSQPEQDEAQQGATSNVADNSDQILNDQKQHLTRSFGLISGVQCRGDMLRHLLDEVQNLPPSAEEIMTELRTFNHALRAELNALKRSFMEIDTESELDAEYWTGSERDLLVAFEDEYLLSNKVRREGLSGPSNFIIPRWQLKDIAGVQLLVQLEGARRHVPRLSGSLRNWKVSLELWGF